MSELEGRLIPGTETTAPDASGLLAPADPFFAPDGESVGYFDGGQLKRIDISGGAAFVICAAEPSFGASWAADNTILFGQSAGIMRVSANGGTPELVIPAGADEFIYGPQLLPDADSVLFTLTTATGGNRWDAAQIVVQSLSSGQRTVIVQGSDGRYVPTGHVIYAVNDALFAVPFDLERREARGGPVSVVDAIVRASDQARQTPAANYGISDTGTLVYLTGTGFLPPAPPGTLIWVDRRGHEEPLGPPSRRYTSPRVSPDGTRVAFEVRDQRSDIWIWEIRRQLLTRFTSDPAQDVLPVWAPDGQRLFWASDRAGGLVNLYSQSADGTGTAERVTVSPNSQRPHSFTADGTRLFFAEADPTRGRGGAILGMLPMDGDRRVAWLGQPAIPGVNAEISPDGRWLAYESDEIYVQPFPGLSQGRSQISTGGGREPLWARSSKELFYLAPDGTLMGVPVEAALRDGSFAAGIPVPVIAAGPYLRETAFHRGRSYDVAADGARFLRIKIEDGSREENAASVDVVIVQNWTDELKRLAPAN
jgi:serine/threonine-protein kinase